MVRTILVFIFVISNLGFIYALDSDTHMSQSTHKNIAHNSINELSYMSKSRINLLNTYINKAMVTEFKDTFALLESEIAEQRAAIISKLVDTAQQKRNRLEQ